MARFLVVLAAWTAPLASQSQPVTDVQGYPCAQLESRRDGSPSRCVLAADHANGVGVMPAGSVVSFGAPPRIMMDVRLARATSVYGQELPAGATLLFRGGGLAGFWLHDDAVIQGHLLAGHEDGVGHMLHPNGRLRAIWLAHDEEIEGIPCTTSGNVLRMGLHVMKLGTARMVWFYADGRLRQAMLARDVTIGGRRFRKGDVVFVGRDGKVSPAAG